MAETKTIAKSVIIDLVDKESHTLVTRAFSGGGRLYERAQRLLKVPLIGTTVSLDETSNITIRVAGSGEMESTDDIREVLVGLKPAVDLALAQAAMRLLRAESVTVTSLRNSTVWRRRRQVILPVQDWGWLSPSLSSRCTVGASGQRASQGQVVLSALPFLKKVIFRHPLLREI